MQLNQKNARQIAVMMTLLLFASGCTNTSANSFCLWAKPITITENELNSLTEETLRQIDDFNQEFEEHCTK